MALVNFGTVTFAADMLVFDKDGTLIDFEALWAKKTVNAVESLVQGIAGDGALRTELYRTLGYDPVTRRFERGSPVITAATAKLYTIAATVLYRHGWGWLEAETYVEQHFLPAMDGTFAPDLLQPTADVAALFSQSGGGRGTHCRDHQRRPCPNTGCPTYARH